MMNPFDQLILIVDDHEENLLIASEILRGEGYQTATVHSGEEALTFCRVRTQAQKPLPNLILSDVMMPLMDGFTLCKVLKEHPTTENIPVIFITAIADVRSMTKGFDAGGVDYITKPFHAQEMCSRVHVHLSLADMRNELALNNEQLIQLNEEKNNLLSIAAHDLKNPIASIMTASVIIKKHFAKMTPDNILKNVAAIYDTARRMTDIIGNLLDINKIESGEIVPNIISLDVNGVLAKVIQEYDDRAKEKLIRFETILPNEMVLIDADAVILRQIFDNLISNAVKFSPPDHAVRVALKRIQSEQPTTETKTEAVQISIQNQTSFLSEQEKQKLFSKFGKLSNRPTGGESSTGLGLFIVKRLVEAMQGKVWYETVEHSVDVVSVADGTATTLCFTVQFPCKNA
ncbi:MAG: hybrid sensor histidine kinase/response regulator [Candidatus Kapaibacterium sp.]|nr:MAG: hybrid sensor histidine kinase/response regulator [Candidatus Kapabacteria bacterium]